MPDDTNDCPLEIRPKLDGEGHSLSMNAFFVGEVDEVDDGPTITIDLGWLRLARGHVVLLDDPKLDSHRGGVAFKR